MHSTVHRTRDHRTKVTVVQLSEIHSFDMSLLQSLFVPHSFCARIKRGCALSLEASGFFRRWQCKRSESRKEAKVEMMLTRFEPASPPAATFFCLLLDFSLDFFAFCWTVAAACPENAFDGSQDKKSQNKSNGRLHIAFFALLIVSLSSTLHSCLIPCCLEDM